MLQTIEDGVDVHQARTALKRPPARSFRVVDGHLLVRNFVMSVSKWRSWPTTRAGSTKGSRRRRYSPLSPGGLGDWLLEVRCMLSTVSSISTANPVGSGFSLSSGQTEIIDVSTTPVLDLLGNLNNQGTIYLVSTNPLVLNQA
jgi:hypothetical protein